jgi:hypothetical protein
MDDKIVRLQTSEKSFFFWWTKRRKNKDIFCVVGVCTPTSNFLQLFRKGTTVGMKGRCTKIETREDRHFHSKPLQTNKDVGRCAADWVWV